MQETAIAITSVQKQETAFCKQIRFTHEGQEYSALLFWDTHHGYDMTFLDDGGKWVKQPAWVDEWEESQQHGGESFEYTLDSLTEEISA